MMALTRLVTFSLFLVGTWPACAGGTRPVPPTSVEPAEDASLAQDAESVEDAPADPSNGDVEYFPAFDPELWGYRPCGGTFAIHPVTNDPFSMPAREPGPNPVQTASEVLRSAPSANEVYRLLAAQKLEPGSELVYDLFSPRSEDVHLYLYATTDRSAEELAKERAILTVMVDYQPADAIWERWSDDHQTVLAGAEGPAFSFPAPRRVEIIELKIPSSNFPDARAYEISLGMEITSTALGPKSHSRRLVLYNGGYEIKQRPCARAALFEEATDIERWLFGLSLGPVMLFTDLTGPDDDHKTITTVPGGSTIRIYATAFRMATSPRVTALQPTVNGEPLGEPIWLTIGGANTQSYPFVDGRFSFEYTVPEAPGLYEIVVFTWEDAFETFRDLDGNRIEGRTSRSKNSNSIRLFVE